MNYSSVVPVIALILSVGAPFSSFAQEAKSNPQQVGEMKLDPKDGATVFKEPGYSPYAGRRFPTQVFWGDTHLHTDLSLDARAFGVTLGPEEAFRFARGEEVVSSHGIKVKLRQPLDFLVVTDHSDGYGSMNEIIAGNPNLLRDPQVRAWNEMLSKGGEEAFKATMEIIQSITTNTIPEVMQDPAFIQSIWDRYIDLCEEYNEPGRFTAMIGYEWTSTASGNNLHRNVLYRDGGARARQLIPYTTAESNNPEDLWKWMAEYEKTTGGKVLALAHNGNLSNGIMFPVETNPETGEPLDGDYMKERIRWEPLYEVTQIKGDGETHPKLSPNDEFADYESWDLGNLDLSVLKKDEMLQYEYGRSALMNGLKLAEKFGTNPYQFGMVGSTDSHTSLATADEDNFFGKHSGNEPNPGRIDHAIAEFNGKRVDGYMMASSGYAAVWATENTREALWDAMMRKEVYATTGPRMMVRFFGGWEFTEEDAESRLPAENGYTKGVPMGGELFKAPEGKSPTFLVGALKDPYGANLDRIQIIKGWLDADGKTHEKIYNVDWSDPENRKLGDDGKLPPVGNTVDLERASWKNTIGTPELLAAWTDPDFDPKQRAFYYARVLEIPTPRWTVFDAKRFEVKLAEMDDEWKFGQERAYTSPIWYTP